MVLKLCPSVSYHGKTAAAAKKTAEKKAVSKITSKVYLQYLGREINKDDLVAQVEKIWTDEMGRKASEIRNITLYLKPEENAAYYVVNDEVSGKLDL